LMDDGLEFGQLQQSPAPKICAGEVVVMQSRLVSICIK